MSGRQRGFCLGLVEAGSVFTMTCEGCLWLDTEKSWLNQQRTCFETTPWGWPCPLTSGHHSLGGGGGGNQSCLQEKQSQAALGGWVTHLHTSSPGL